jgi:acetoacetyl-CoA synthetase
VTGTPLLPLYANEIQAKSLGMAVEVFHSNFEEGRQNAITTDEPGELVCTQPFPSQPLTFWGPGGQEKYFNSYFSMFGPTTWVQGDLIRISTTTKGIQMLGRS